MSEHICQTNDMDVKDFLIKIFIENYGGDESKIIISAAPGRINIIGEHLDYNGGFVLPAAIDKQIYIAARKRNDSKVFYRTANPSMRFEFDLNNELAYCEENGFANYLNGMIKMLKDKSFIISSGFEIFIYGNLPQGAGLSSSAALQVCFGKAVSELFGFIIDKPELAKIAQKNENKFLNLKCGIMDPFCILYGKKDNAVFLNTITLDFNYIRLNTDGYKFVVINSNKKRKLTESKFNLRKAECGEGVRILKKKLDIDFLCEITEADFEYFQINFFDKEIKKRVRHCITENARVHKAVKALKDGDIKTLGALMSESHISLRDDYETTGFELDTIFDSASAQEGCLGVRATGAGFGGCAIALVEETAVEDFCLTVGKDYNQKTNSDADFFVCNFCDGAKII